MNKNEMTKIILKYLQRHPKTQYGEVKHQVETELARRGITGQIQSRQGNVNMTRNVRISDDDALLINQVIWDLISERVLTPGINRDNFQWPFFHVSDMSKLDEKLSNLN